MEKIVKCHGKNKANNLDRCLIVIKGSFFLVKIVVALLVL